MSERLVSLVQDTAIGWPCGLMNKASVSGAEDCRFESCHGRYFCTFYFMSTRSLIGASVPSRLDQSFTFLNICGFWFSTFTATAQSNIMSHDYDCHQILWLWRHLHHLARSSLLLFRIRWLRCKECVSGGGIPLLGALLLCIAVSGIFCFHKWIQQHWNFYGVIRTYWVQSHKARQLKPFGATVGLQELISILWS